MATKKKATRTKRIKKPSRPDRKAAKRTAAPKKAAKASGKKVRRKPAPKPAAKRPAARKAARKVPAHKAHRQAQVRAPANKAGLKKRGPKPAKAPVSRPMPKPISVASPGLRKVRPARAFRPDELAFFRAHLQKQLELVQGNLNALASDNLKRSPIEATGDISAHSTHMADQGTDNFDRELALNLASGRQESIYDIEDAIRRIDDGTYGACESCGQGIERARLKALPFAKKCMLCQNAAERGRTFYRPFGGTLPLQQLAAEDAAAEPPDSLS